MEDVLSLAAAVVIVLALRQWAAELIRVKGSSMLSTLHNGDILGVTRWDYRVHPPRRLDVVICYYPGRYIRWKGKKLFRACFVKRVIGLPGETVELRDSVVHINGLPLAEPYLDPMKNRRLHNMPPVTLGEDEVFVLGDNRDNSNDSRRVGPLKLNMLRGRVRCVLFPPKHWRRMQ